jgi:uncharacterized protein YbaR (Trm112 family)
MLLHKGSWTKMILLSMSQNRQDVLKRLSDQVRDSAEFDIRMLQHLACPLSKASLRYEKETNELICDEIKVAYPIVDGVPNFIPQLARKLNSADSPVEQPSNAKQ